MSTESQIAVIGMACRLPGGANDPESLWSMLAEGRDGLREVPKDRWDWRSFYHEDGDAKEAANFSHGYYVSQDVSAFDARFFGISSAEANGIDPQQRLLLETTYEAVENAGIPIESLRGSDTSVHMAIFARDYDRMGYRDMPQLHQTHILGSGDAILSNRISYVLDLKGSSNTLDTGCSGSLVALHQACRALRADESRLALAGASQLLLTPDQSIAMCQLTNKDGKCYTFDDRGSGYGRGEGLGVLVLKRLDRALADGDAVHAIIVESGVGHDGKTSGIFLPNADAQEALARSIYAKAGLDPRETLYVEAHGTGTVAGDNAEIQSTAKVFGREAGRKSELPVGSIKTNIGHLEGASGVASVIKAVMVLKKNQIPPHLNYINPKPGLHLEERGIKVPLELTSLTPKGHVGPRRVSVNSFGYGGTNAHVILEAYDRGPVTDSRLPNGHSNGLTSGHPNGHFNGYSNGHSNGYSNGHSNGDSNGYSNGNSNDIANGDSKYHDTERTLVVLSASSETSLNNVISKLQKWLASDQGNCTSFTDLAYTLNVRRSKLPWRCSVMASNSQELERALGDSKLRPVKSAKGVGVAFIFTGQGAQWFAMGRELLSTSRVFASSVALCNQVMQGLGCDWDLVGELSRDKGTTRLGDSRFSQPCTTAVQIALVDLLESYGIRPETVCGHSSGEIAAAYAAGALGKEAAMQASYNRGIWSSAAKGLNATSGTMLAVGEGEEAIKERIQGIAGGKGKMTVACVNSPESTTISGDLAAIEALQAILDAASVFNRRLQVDSAYHSHHMEVVAPSYLSSLDNMAHGMARKDVAFYSTVTGTRNLSDFGPSYWVSNLVSQVKFSAASRLVAEHLSAAGSAANSILLEVGPHSALAGPLRQSLSDFKVLGGSFEYNYVPCLVRNENAVSTTLALVGKVFEAGCPVQLDAVMHGNTGSSSHYQVVDNLPTYAWDHSTYWHESRLSKGHRLRPFPNHDLLGLFDVHSSPNEPRWRHHVSLQTLPWLRDHVVEEFVIFPGAGYLTMATEAMKQLFQMRKTPGHIKSINFRDIAFAAPVIVRGDGASASAEGDREVELHLTISPARQYAGSRWEYFRVLSYDSQSDSWIEHCTGLTTCESEAQPQPDQVDGTRIDDSGLGHLTMVAAAEMLADIQANSPVQVDPAGVYGDLAVSGNTYGPSFQGMKEIHVGKCCGLARIVVDDVAQMMPGHYMQPHTIHPTALDAMIQIEAVFFRRECSIAPMMPVMVGEISISADLDATPGAEVLVAGYLFPESRRSALGSFCAYQKQSDGTFLPVLTASAIRLQAVGEVNLTNSLKRKTTYRLEYKPDVDYITQHDFTDHVARHNLLDIGYGTLSKLVAEEQVRLNDQVATIFVRRALDRVREENMSTACTPHLTKLLRWMVEWNRSEAEQLLAGVTPDDEAQLIEQASNDNIAGFTLGRFGPRLFDLFMGQADALELLLQDNMLSRLYSEDTLFNSHYAQMVEYMQMLVHKNPKMKILEVGAGTGSATMPLMESIERNGRLLLDEYAYTDISSGFFERARGMFSKWTSQIDFKTLDISRDPLTQGYTAHTFDLIVASLVLHATPLMDVTMANVRKLLKPGGRLILIELTQLAAARNVIFGTLEGWWMSEDGRKDGPLLSVSEWDSVLKRHGFSGADLVIPAHIGKSSAVSSLIVTQATDTLDMSGSQDIRGPGPVVEMKASVRLGHSHPSQAAFGDAIRLSLGNKGVICDQQAWGMTDAATDAARLLIVIDSAEHPLLLDPAQEVFEQTKRLLLQGKNVLWVSFQYSAPSAETVALKNMVNGVGRVVRHENPSLRLITVDVQDQIQLTGSGNGSRELDRIVQTLGEIVMSSFWPVSDAIRAEELEYTICDGKLSIPRVIPDDHFANYIDSQNPDQDQSAASMVDCKYLDIGRPLMFDVQVPGLLNTIRFVDNNMMAEPLGPDEIEIQTYAHGVNFKDVFIALGQMQPGASMSGEAAGVVTAVGSNAQWKIGDRVLGLMVAPFGNLVRMNSAGTVAIPDSITFADAASMSVIYYTAWYCLTHVARLEKGQTVLVHAASGGVGQAAIQLAKLIGAEIFATASSVSKRKLIQDQYGIPKSHIFSSQSRHVKKGIMRSTQGKGVDVVLNSLSGEILMDSWDCVAQFGTFVEIGKTDIYGRSQLNMANFEKQATFAAVDVSHMMRLRPEYVARGLREVFAMADKGLVKPVHPVTTYPISRIEETFRLIAARKHVGKLVLVADEHTIVQAPRPKAPPLRLHREGTYVIGGGLGDLGKRIGRFLVEHGAGHIVALTRRNIDSQLRVSLEESISQLGGTLHIVKCDIGNEENTRAAAKEIAALPPVRGVIQSALVLCDHPLEYMEVKDWDTAVKPKVWGTRNMHKAFCSPETTDFFIMLSSIASLLGSPSQSNYAAGNAFQDAFSRACTQGTQGITQYTTINVGAVEGSEQITRALNQDSNMARIISVVSFDELLATLEYTMGPQARLDQAMQCIMSFDRDTMEDAIGPTALSDHLFDHVPSKRSQEETISNSATDSNKPSVTQAVERAKTVEEADDIVKQALLEKFAAFIGDEPPADQPILSLGLDSLISIELKNWIKHIFQTPLQTSELIGAQSIIALAKLIVSRMDLKCKVKVKADDDDEKQEGAHESQTEPSPENMNAIIANGHDHDGNTKPRHGLDCCRLSEELPDLPLPDLDDALDFWLEANRHLYSTQQLESIQQDIQTMRAPGSPARQVLQDLFKAHEHEESNAWYNDVLTDARWLSRRSPIAPYSSIMGAHRDSKRPQSQAERAAIISLSTLSFKRAMKAGTVEPLQVGGKPECTWRRDWLFDSVRVPHVGCDKMMRYNLNDQNARAHIAVLRRGHVFRVMLQDQDQGKDVPFGELKATFEAIVAQVEDDGVWSGILTTDERDSWALIRKKLSALSPANAEYFHVIDAAMFVLCLDDGCPETPGERVRQGYIGDGSNRWFDKVLQVYVSANGRSGVISEHGAIDGTTPGRLWEWVVAAIDKYLPGSSLDHDQLNGSLSSRVELKEVVLQTTPEIESHIHVLRSRFLEYTSPATRTYVREHLTEFGTDFLVQSKVSIKGVVDMTFQLALRLFFGRNIPSWEPTSAAHYHTGRSDAVQKATPAVIAFCDAAAEAYQDQDQSQHGKTARLAALLSPATKQMHVDMQTMLNGRSYMRVFEVLSWLWPSNAGTPKPRFLSEHIFFGKPFPTIFAQSNGFDAEMIVEDFAHMLTDTEGFWTIIWPGKSEIYVYLTGGSPERTAAFIKQLHRAAIILRDIVQAA